MRIPHKAYRHPGAACASLRRGRDLAEYLREVIEDCEVAVVVVGDVYDTPDPAEAEIVLCQEAFAAIRPSVRGR